MRSYQNFWKPYLYESLLQLTPGLIAARERRILRSKFQETLKCKDNAKIPREANAGQIENGFQIMHNGIRVELDCYSTSTNKGMMTELFRQNRGVHEPSEEYAFQEILKEMPPNATILELGAWWAFYSMWFCKAVPNAKAYMIEPIAENVAVGRRNFAANGFSGQFHQAFVGRTSGYWVENKRSLWRGNYQVQTDVPLVCVDDFIESRGIPFVNILHSDIQGAELDMLKGAEKSVRRRLIHYFVISTHENYLHYDCLNWLKEHDFAILCEVDLDHCMHMDGFIVARAKEMPGPSSITIDKLEL